MAINFGLNLGTTQQQGSQALNFFQQARGRTVDGPAAPAVATPAAAPAPPAVEVPVGNAAEPTAFVREPAAHAAAPEGGGMRGAIADVVSGNQASVASEVADAAVPGETPNWFNRLRSTPSDQIFTALNGGREPGERAGVHAGDVLARLRAGAAPAAEQAVQVAGQAADEVAHVATEAAHPVAQKLFQFGTQGATRMGSSAAEIGKLGTTLLELGTKLRR